jgi:hypothetical protein
VSALQISLTVYQFKKQFPNRLSPQPNQMETKMVKTMYKHLYMETVGALAV